jgi:hypothetical protein
MYQLLPGYSCAEDQKKQSIDLLSNEAWLLEEQRPLLRTVREFRKELGTHCGVPAISIFDYGIKTVTRVRVKRNPQGRWEHVDFDVEEAGMLPFRNRAPSWKAQRSIRFSRIMARSMSISKSPYTFSISGLKSHVRSRDQSSQPNAGCPQINTERTSVMLFIRTFLKRIALISFLSFYLFSVKRIPSLSSKNIPSR